MLIDIKYLKSFNGLIKVGEFIGLVICIALMISFRVQLSSADQSDHGSFDSFFLFVTITCLALVILSYLVRLMSAHIKISVKWTIVIIVTSGISFGFLLISSSLILSEAVVYDSEIVSGKTKCELWKGMDISCPLFTATGVIGLLLSLLFLLETIVGIRYHCTGIGELDLEHYGTEIQEKQSAEWDDGDMLQNVPTRRSSQHDNEAHIYDNIDYGKEENSQADQIITTAIVTADSGPAQSASTAIENEENSESDEENMESDQNDAAAVDNEDNSDSNQIDASEISIEENTQ